MLMAINNDGSLSQAILIDTPTCGVAFTAYLHVAHIFVKTADAPKAIV